MTPHKLSSFAAVLCFIFVSSMKGQQFPAQRSPRLPNFETGRKDVGVTPLVLLRPGLGRAGENCAVDRAVQARLTSGQKTYLSRLAGIACAAEGSVRRIGKGIEESDCD